MENQDGDDGKGVDSVLIQCNSSFMACRINCSSSKCYHRLRPTLKGIMRKSMINIVAPQLYEFVASQTFLQKSRQVDDVDVNSK
jgi:hypothetical protein